MRLNASVKRLSQMIVRKTDGDGVGPDDEFEFLVIHDATVRKIEAKWRRLRRRRRWYTLRRWWR
jgi:hypothetical protein